MSDSQPSSKKPISATIVPLTIICLAVLEGVVTFAQNEWVVSEANPILLYSFGAISIVIQLVAGVLIASRMALGRRIYLISMPVLIVASGILTWFMMNQSTVPYGNPTTEMTISLLVNLAIYGGMIFFLFRPVLSQWFIGTYTTEAPATLDKPLPQLLILLNSLAGRLAFLFILVLVLVLVFGAPIEMIYFYVVATPIALLLRSWLKRRS